MIQLFIGSYLAAVLGLVAIVNPLGMAPVFLRYTDDATHELRVKFASRVAFGGFALIGGSIFAGSHILNFFGLTISAVQIGGGLVVALSGWGLLQQGSDNKKREERSEESLSNKVTLSDAFYPLTLPLTVGPGTLSVAMTLGAKDMAAEYPLLSMSGSIAGAATIGLIIYVCYRFADVIFGRLGAAGSDIVLRLSAFILLCLGVQIAWNGIMSGLSAAH